MEATEFEVKFTTSNGTTTVYVKAATRAEAERIIRTQYEKSFINLVSCKVRSSNRGM